MMQPGEGPASTDLESLPGQVVNWLGSTLTQGMHKLTDLGGRALAFLPEPGRTTSTSNASNYLEASISLQDVQVEQLASSLGVRLPFPLKGRLSFQVQLGIP